MLLYSADVSKKQIFGLVGFPPIAAGTAGHVTCRIRLSVDDAINASRDSVGPTVMAGLRHNLSVLNFGEHERNAPLLGLALAS